jgi:drug/metabolite transporter (DMT)-like permease
MAKLERGVWYAIFATIGMGTANFLFGLGARATSPLVINWFSNTFIAIVALGYLAATTQLGAIVLNFKEKKRLILNVSFFDNLAWISFSYAMLYIPIAVATGISEGYIAFAAGLGLTFNHEHLRPHQKVGFVLAIAAVIVLALVTDK